MPEFGSANRTVVRVVEESAWGVTPTSPALQNLRFTSESLNVNGGFETSSEIRDDRMTADVIPLSYTAGGDISVELSFATYDSFFEGALFTDWVTTGSTVSAATDIAIVKSGSTWTLTSSSTDLSAQSWVVGQDIQISGFGTAGTFQAQIAGTPAANSVAIIPLADIASEAAGDEVTIVPLNFARNGVTNKSYTLQKGFNDLATIEYYNFPGARVGTFSIDITSQSIVTMAFSFMAKTGEMTESQFSGATVAASNTNPVMNSSNNVASIRLDNDPSASPYYYTTLNVSIDNSLREQGAIGSLTNVGIEPGRCVITGNLEIYFVDSSVFDTFKAASSLSLTFKLADADGNMYLVTVPRVRITNYETVAGGADSDLFASIEFEAFVNAAGTHQFQISRLAA